MRRDFVGAGLGSVSIDRTESVVVGRRYVVRVTYTAGPRGIEVRGAVRFRLPGLTVEPDSTGPVSCSNPAVEWSCSNHLPAVEGKNGKEFFVTQYLFVVIQGARLNEGDSVTVQYGGNLALHGTAAPQEAQKWPVEVAVDVDGSRAAPGSGFYLVDNSPVVRFVNDRPCRMEAFLPSYTCVDECFSTTIRVMDKHNNLVEDYTGSVVLEAQTAEGHIDLGEHRITPGDRGVLVVHDTVLRSPGVHRIVARDEALGTGARSNPTRTTVEKPGILLFWGDTHCHSRFSADTSANNCLIADPAADYDYARYRSALDFCMVTDHIEDQSEEEWAETRRAARAAYEPHRFVTFSAFEATYRPLRSDGDKNVYFFDDSQDWVNRGTTEELYENLKQRRARVLVVPHLHAQTNWHKHDPDLERVVEVYAHWGCGLSDDTDLPIVPGTPRRPESYVHYALDRGAKLGFIASADHSHGHPGDDFWWKLSSYNGGLAAVLAPELTRSGIWNGLWSRRCYGTTRARILLEFSVNGHSMGEEFALAEGPRELAANVYGTSAIQAVEVVKNGRVLTRTPGDRRLDVELAFRDDDAERGADYYYLHVRQEDGEQAWSSPVWVTHRS